MASYPWATPKKSIWIGLRPANLLKRDSNAGVFLRIFRNAFKCFKTYINIFTKILFDTILLLPWLSQKLWNIFDSVMSSLLVTLLLKIISPVKSKHIIKDEVILLNDILIDLYLNELQIFFCLSNMYKLLQWRAHIT